VTHAPTAHLSPDGHPCSERSRRVLGNGECSWRREADWQADFACPGVFGNYSAFARQFEKPILKARTPNCNKKDADLGLDRSEQVRSTCWFR
jgi:hypothetical protein